MNFKFCKKCVNMTPHVDGDCQICNKGQRTMSNSRRFPENINLEGPKRVVKMTDGWYVVGEGSIMKVSSQEEGMKYLENQDLNEGAL